MNISEDKIKGFSILPLKAEQHYKEMMLYVYLSTLVTFSYMQ